MAADCTQTATIGAMQKTLEHLVVLVEQVVEQRIELKHIGDRQIEHRDWLKGLERRIRQMEVHPGQVAGKVLILVCTLLGSAVGSIVAGIVVWSLRNGS